MGTIELVKEVSKKGMQLPTGEIESVFPPEATKVTRDFLNTKAKIR